MKWQSLITVFISIVFSSATFAGGDIPQVIIKDFKFIPQEITIKRGDTLRWENQEKRQYHSVWFEVFKKTGTFPYRCGPHPKMTGTVHVTD